ncbi:MAG: hypothetical protein S0880_37740 [Actinomycetota bacterium]|nr:hypothetical protein [Actinomycetota bacterium]
MRQSRIDAILSLIDETLAEMPEPGAAATPANLERERSAPERPAQSRPAA